MAPRPRPRPSRRPGPSSWPAARRSKTSSSAPAYWLAAGVATAGPTGAPTRVRPLAGGDPVPATAADLDAAVRLADALPEVAVLAGPPVHAAGETPLGELACCLAGTSKHVMASSLTTAAQADAAVAMAAAAAGSAGEARRRPPLSLCGSAGALDAALVFARAGLPVGLVPSPADTDAAAPAPPAAAGLGATLVRHHAGVLAGCAAVQAAAPGAPYFYVADPATAGLPAAGPSAALFQLAAAQLADLVGLPIRHGRPPHHQP